MSIAFAASLGLFAVQPAYAQDNTADLVRPGDAIVTGFSGVLDRSGAAGRTSDATKLFIDPDGASVRGFDVSQRGAGGATGQTLAPEFLTITARQVGQVFGVALDDATNPSNALPAPNIYVTATSAYGLALIRPDQDGKPQRLFAGAADAEWMDGQFGEGGGPGSIWKIDGLSGQVSLLANVTHDDRPNRGPGLGNIVFDPRTRQLFVSDRATGLIHRFGLDGADLGTFDHGVTARAAAGLRPVSLQDRNGAILTSPAFRTADPSTWGFAGPRRRVWGLAVRQQRLYYSVADESQVWSVRLSEDGSFDTGSARFELKLADNAQLLEIADITFTPDGDMILAQRPPTTGAPDFGVLAKVRPARLLRYRAETPDNPGTRARWQPVAAEYAVGITGQLRSAAGGVALGFGYDPSGALDPNACAATVWVTGDALRKSPIASPGAGAPEQGMAAGIQGLSVDSLRQDGTPPADAFVVDFDGQFPRVRENGHVGDVAIAGPCPSEVAVAPGVAPPAAPGMAAPAAPGVPPAAQPQQADLSIAKRLIGPCAQGQDCRFELVVTNVGAGDYQGPLVLSDTVSIAGMALAGAAPAPWTCGQAGDQIGCNHPTLLLRPGHSTVLPLTLNYAGNAPGWQNCAAITWLGQGTADPQGLRAVQIELASLGYYGGPINGVADNDTRNAIRALQKDLGLPETGEITPELLDWLFGQGASTVADANPGNDGPVCVTVGPETPPTTDTDLVGQLQVEKTGPGKCDFNTLCKFGIKITNPTNQAIKVTAQAIDEMTRTHDGAALANSIPVGEAPGLCSAGEGPAGVAKTPLKCTADIDLGPNQSKTYTIGIRLDDPKLDPANNANLNPDPNVAFIAAENCILFQIPGVPLKSCASVALGAPATAGFDLAIEKSLLQAAAGGMIQGCDPNQPCRFTIRITNNGPGPYIGPLIVKDDVPAGWKIANWAGPTVCEQKGDVVSCSMAPQTTLAAGQSVDWTIGLQPVPSQSDQMVQVKNCAEIDWKGGPGDANSGNDGKVCADVNIPPVPKPPPEGAGAYSGPQGKAFDLTIEKGSPHDAPGAAAGAGMLYACEAQKPCPFAVTITNIGIDQYDGPVSFLDTSEGGWSYGGASAGWSCTPAASGFTCTGNVSLAPGASTRINITLNPMAGVPLDPVQGQNCAQLVWKDGKGDINAGNDGPSCMPVSLAASVPTAPGVAGVQGAPPVEKPDIKVTKELVSACEPGGECTFNITIRGTQDFPLKDKFKLEDQLPSEWKFAGGGKFNLWTCDTNPETVDCTYDVEKYPGLPANGFTKSDVLLTEIRLKVPANQPEGNAQNCVWVTFEPPATGEIRKDTKIVCVQIPIAFKSKLTIKKSFDQPTCAPGAPCPYSITIKNEGKGDYQGFLVVNDEFITGGSDYQRDSISSGDFECRGVLGQPAGLWTPAQAKPGQFICVLAAPGLPNAPKVSSFPPGTTRVIRVSGKFRSGTKLKTAENCADIEFYGSDPKDLSNAEKRKLVKRFLRHKGHAVSSGTGFSTSDEKVLAKYKKDSGYNDSSGKPDTSGKITDDFLASLLPKQDPDYSDAKILPGTGRFFQSSCATVSLGKTGLVIDKQGPPAGDYMKGKLAQTPEAQNCLYNRQCTFTITVKGDSDNPYTDPVVVVDSTKNAWWRLKSYKGQGWQCGGTTRFTCTHPPANLTKSKSLKLTLTMEPSQAFVNSARGAERHPWIYNCAKIKYTDQTREGPQSCYKLRLFSGEGHTWEFFDFDATGTGSCTPPNCSFYEFTATRTAGRRQGPAGSASDFDATGTGNCQPPNCGAVDASATMRTAAGYSAPMSIVIKPPPKARFANVRLIRAPPQCAASGWSCTQSGREFGNTITCRSSLCTMRPGDRLTLRLDGKVAPELTEPPETEQTRKVCGELQYQRQSGSGGIEQKVGTETRTACVITRIAARPPPKGDLQVSSAPQGRCRIGASCAVGNTIANAGGNRFVTPANMQIRGQVDPPVSIRGLRAESAGWSCRTTGGGRYACIRTSSPFATADTERISLALAIPRNFSGDKITHSVRIVWPAATDSNSANDSAVFTIPVRAPYVPPPVVAPKPEPRPVPPQEAVTPPKPQPTKIICIGGSILRGNQTCVCRNRKVPVKIGPNAFRCECPSGSVEVRGLCITCPRGTRWDGRRCAGTKPSPAPAPAPPPISCRGGAVVRGICVCPRGTTRQQRGARSYQCVPLRLQTIPGMRLAPAPARPRLQTVPGGRLAPAPAPPRLQTVPGGRLAPAPPRLRMVPGGIICPPKTKLVNGKCVPVVQ